VEEAVEEEARGPPEWMWWRCRVDGQEYDINDEDDDNDTDNEDLLDELSYSNDEIRFTLAAATRVPAV
jgi:hypothetical protein